MVDILVIFGPNLNLLGTRELEIYGADSMADILKELAFEAERLGRSIEIIQSNEEGVLVTAIQEARDKATSILFNLAAYTHTSLALRDCLLYTSDAADE